MDKCQFIDQKLSNYELCDFLTQENASKVYNFVKTQEDYNPTPLVSLDCLSKKLGVGKIYIKDESKRMGLNAFKGVGVFYGTIRVICKELNLDIEKLTYTDFIESPIREQVKKFTFVAVTDGNHGKGLAWVANKLGCKCYIYVPKNTTASRVKAIEDLGAIVTVTDLNYDDTLKLVIDVAKENNWLHIQDQAWEGYTEPTNFISEGYTIIADEALKQMKKFGTEQPTHIIAQAGAGSFAFGILGYYANCFPKNKPYMIIAEPHNAGCYYASIKSGETTAIKGDLETVMAGLSVGEVNIVAWKYLKTIVEGFITCDDSVTAQGMRILSSPCGTDQRIVSGESGALGLGVLSTVCGSAKYDDLKKKMNIDEKSVILLISTEGDTDPEMYEKIIWDGLHPSENR